MEGVKLRIMEGMKSLHLVCVFSGSHVRIPRPFVYLGCQSPGNISLGMGQVMCPGNRVSDVVWEWGE